MDAPNLVLCRGQGRANFFGNWLKDIDSVVGRKSIGSID